MAEKGRVWSDAETKLLLEIWSQENIQKQLQGSFRNVNVYSKLVEELRRSGYHRTVTQCRIKIKALKKRYKEIVDRARRSGTGNESEEEDLPDDFQYYSQIDAVMTGRPSVTPVHLLDSASYDEENDPSGSRPETPNPPVSRPETPGSSGQQVTPGSSGQQATPGSSGQQEPLDSSVQQAIPGSSGQEATPVLSGQQAPGHSSKRSSDDEQPPKKKRKRTTKLQKAEKAGNAMVLELIAANEEARKERMAWEKQLSEIEDAKEQKRADSDRQMILTAMGQMISAFTQYMGPAASFFPYPSSPPHHTPSFPPGYYQPHDPTFLPPPWGPPPGVPPVAPPGVPPGVPPVAPPVAPPGVPPVAPAASVVDIDARSSSNEEDD